jgi:methylenetetrahydrofolate dehydrogenase (NADP+) / methenyltetrahydrofolate cyclohydrolase
VINLILDGKTIKEEQLKELKPKVKDLNLSLAVIEIGDNEASNIYISQKEKMCKSLNINFKCYHFKEDAKEEEILNLINKLNNDNTTGILLQLPIPPIFNKERLENAINYQKDVDGLNRENIARLYNNEKSLIPCTAKGILTMLNYYNINVEGLKTVVIGRSNLVGKPVAILLMNNNATVTLCHSKTANLKEYTQNADLIICATGKPHMLTKDMINNNSLVIDVGITRENGKLLGDVDFDNVKDFVKAITPVPGGVGPMTILSLAQNIYEASLLQNKN